VSDGQVALYLEERDPSLQAAILSAIESAPAADGSDRGPSPALVERLVDQAIEKCRALEDGIAVERASLRRQLYALGGIAAVATLLIVFGPAFLRSGMSALLIVSRSAEAASPYKIEVTPGNARVPRGADQNIKAKLLGFSSPEATLMVRTDPQGDFERVPLVTASEPGSFEGMLFHLDKSSDYYVESNGVRSTTFKMDVVDLPTVDKLAVEYHFPAYTGLEPRTVDPGGDIAALKGTDVRLKITPTMSTPGGRVILNEKDSVPLTKEADGTFAANFSIKEQGFYKIELEGPAGEKVDASPQYTIDVLTDQGPSVRFEKPGRDTNATPVEEVFAQVKADDDYGVKQVEMFYSVNGGPEKTVHLFGGSKALPEVTASHTIYLEELGLKPGDFVSYYAKASDNDGVEGSQTTTSDIYFVQIRPFKKDYKPAQSMAGMGGGGGGDQVNQLSQQQREIVAATFNIVRDRAKMSADKFREQTVFLTLAQAKLRQQVEELSGKMNSRLDAVDPAFKTIAEALPKAAGEMKTAEGNLKGLQAKEALSPEQRALKLLQDAEQQYEVQVAQQRGGGGGGGQNQMSEDLADLFELELDKLANQYEMQQRAEQQGADKQVDELAEKLKELARRQQQEAERQQRLAALGQQSGGGGSDSQRQLARELEEAARKLEQLSREQPRRNLADAARQLQDAANAMKQAAANGSRDAGAQAAAALDKIKQAQQRLQQNQGGRGERDVQDAMRQAQSLSDEQRQIASDVQGLEGAQGAAREQKAQALQQRKDAMDQKLGDLQDQLEKLANDARANTRDAARKLDEAAGSITDKRMREKVRYTKNTLRGQPSEYARAMEADIQANLDALKNKIGEAQAAFGQADKQDAVERAVDKTRDLVRGMESLDQRMRDKAQQNARNGQQGQNGQQNARGQQSGQDGQQSAQQGQQGQSGQQGQQGSQGQNGQQGQQGGQGQQAGGQQGGAQAGGNQAGGRNSDGTYAGGAFGGRYDNGYGPNRGVYRFDPADARQFRNDFRQWQNDAQSLRRDLTQAGVDTKDLDQILRDLRAFDSDAAFTDGNSLALLQAQALDKLKKFEFALRRKAEGGDQPLSLSGSDEVPSGFRQAIEEYYRALAKKQQ
jgi:hypothetical protein